MKLHGNARTCPHSRLVAVRRVLEEGWTLAAAAEAAGVGVCTISKWLRRYRDDGEPGLADRSSAPARVPRRTSEDRVELIALLRWLRMTGAEIAETLAMPLSTVSAVLARIGLGRLSRLEPPEPPNRYERKRSGELVSAWLAGNSNSASVLPWHWAHWSSPFTSRANHDPHKCYKSRTPGIAYRVKSDGSRTYPFRSPACAREWHEQLASTAPD